MMPLLLAIAFALPGADATWTTLSEKPVHVECTESEGQPFCRSTAVFEAEIGVLRQTLLSMDESSDKFDSIVSVDKLDEDVMRVVMDFPWPLADREYVAKYSREDREDGGMVLSWVHTEHPKAGDPGGNVRLTEFAGSWTLSPEADGRTRVEYLWHGEYGGALPDGGLNMARKKTGQESLKDLAKACGGVKYVAP